MNTQKDTVEVLPGFVGPFQVRFGCNVYDSKGKFLLVVDGKNADDVLAILNSHAQCVRALKELRDGATDAERESGVLVRGITAANDALALAGKGVEHG